MRRLLLLLLTPGWLARHVLVVLAVLAFGVLGRWQWHRAHGPDATIQNFGYAFEWWVFAAFAVFMWWKMVRDALDPAPPPAAARPVQPVAAVPASDGEPEPDDELAAYNRYLAQLNAGAERQPR